MPKFRTRTWKPKRKKITVEITKQEEALIRSFVENSSSKHHKLGSIIRRMAIAYIHSNEKPSDKD